MVNKAGWPNGKALDYESRDCRFDPCVGHFLLYIFLVEYLLLNETYSHIANIFINCTP